MRSLYLLILLVILQAPAHGMSSHPEDEEQDKRPAVSATRKPVDQAKEVIKSVKSNEAFNTKEQQTGWRFDFDFDEDNKKQTAGNRGFMEEFIRFLSMLIEIMLWLLPVLVIYILYRYRHYWLHYITGVKTEVDDLQPPDVIFGLDIRKDELPDKPADVAMELWQQGQYRQAVSLLYRAALATLFTEYQLDLPPGATEQDCVHHVETTQAGDMAQHFSQLTQLWVLVAYAHRKPDEQSFTHLCQQWQQIYGAQQ